MSEETTPAVEAPAPETEIDATPTQADTPDVDAEEAEYQAAMAAARNNDDTEEPEESEEPKEAATQKIKIKVNGKEREVDLEEARRLAELGGGAQQKFEEAAKIRKQAEQFIRQLKADPASVLANPALGLDVKAWAENYLYSQYEAESMSPEEKAAAQERQELEQYRAERQEREEAAKQQREEEMRKHYKADWDKKFIEAMAEHNLPRSDYTVKRMAEYMRRALKQGYKHITPRDVAPLVRKDMLAAQEQMFSSMGGDQLIELLGQEGADKVRKAQLAKFQKTGQQPVRGQQQREAQPDRTYGSIEEMREAIKRGGR